jgi:hypothetical protein
MVVPKLSDVGRHCVAPSWKRVPRPSFLKSETPARYYEQKYMRGAKSPLYIKVVSLLITPDMRLKLFLPSIIHRKTDYLSCPPG